MALVQGHDTPLDHGDHLWEVSWNSSKAPELWQVNKFIYKRAGKPACRQATIVIPLQGYNIFQFINENDVYFALSLPRTKSHQRQILVWERLSVSLLKVGGYLWTILFPPPSQNWQHQYKWILPSKFSPQTSVIIILHFLLSHFYINVNINNNQ